MKKKFSGAAVITASVAGFALAVLCCTFMFVAKYGGLDAFPYSTKFAAVFTALNEHYVGEMDMEEASNAAYSAMVAATGDRWSRYLTAEQYAAYRLMQQNSYKGIGVTIKNDEAFGYPKVVSLVEDSPAQKAGVMIGDHLLAVNGKSVEKMGTSEISGMIAELADKEFELSVSSGGEEKTLTIKSDVIFSDPIEYEMLEGGSIGYVRIKNFEAKSGEGLVSAVDTLIRAHSRLFLMCAAIRAACSRSCLLRLIICCRRGICSSPLIKAERKRSEAPMPRVFRCRWLCLLTQTLTVRRSFSRQPYRNMIWRCSLASRPRGNRIRRLIWSCLTAVPFIFPPTAILHPSVLTSPRRAA